MTDEILKRIDALAAKVGETGAHVYAVLVRQAWIDGLEYAVMCGVCVTIMLFCVGWLRSSLKDDDGNVQAAAIIIGLLALILGSIFFVSALDNLMNPEFGALQHLKGLLEVAQ